MARRLGLSGIALLAAVVDASAQGTSFGVSADVAVPRGALATRRTAAPYVAASALFRTWGAGVGAGAEIPIRRMAVTVETRAHVILSDYGNYDFETSLFWPVTLGVRF